MYVLRKTSKAQTLSKRNPKESESASADAGFYIREGIMSTAVLAKRPSSTLGVTPAPIDERNLIEKHARSVKLDVERAARKLKCGHPYSILVTPERIAWRCPEAAQTRADLSSTGCEELRVLRKLFRQEAIAHNLGFQFDTELHRNANCGDHLEDVLMLRVFFTCH